MKISEIIMQNMKISGNNNAEYENFRNNNAAFENFRKSAT